MWVPLSGDSVNHAVDSVVQCQPKMAGQPFARVCQLPHLSSERREAAYDVRVPRKEHNVGDWVWYYNPRRFAQRSPLWQRYNSGPYLIVCIIPQGGYVIRTTANSRPFVAYEDELEECRPPTPASRLADHGDINAERVPNVRRSDDDTTAGVFRRAPGHRPRSSARSGPREMA